MIIDRLLAAMRDDEYIEHDARACDEADTYETKPNGSLGAVDGCKDDKVITSAGCVWLALEYMPLPRIITPGRGRVKRRIVGEATI